MSTLSTYTWNISDLNILDTVYSFAYNLGT